MLYKVSQVKFQLTLHIFRFGEDLRPACLWVPDEIPNMEVDLVGKGPISAHTTYSEATFDYTSREIYARSSSIPQSTCNNFYSDDGLQISENQLCYGNSIYILPNSCQLAPGGPVTRKYHGTSFSFHQYQVGVQVYGNDCGFGYPAVSTRVSKYIDWIDSIIFGESKISQAVEDSQNVTTFDTCKSSEASNVCESLNGKLILECATELRRFRKPVSNNWPPTEDDHYSTAHITILRRDSQEIGYGALITNQHVLTSNSNPHLLE